MSQPNPAAADPSRDTAVTARTSGTLCGCEVDLEIHLDARRLVAWLHYLKGLGFEPHRRPLAFELTADGAPICPRHRVPMRRREKQGDQWHSHKLVVAPGRELYCRGYPGPDSPGYDVEPAAPADRP